MQVVDRKVWRPASSESAKWIGHVRLAPNGKRMAYLRIDDDAAGIFVESADGSTHEVHRCADDMLAEDIRWSPDGKWLAYSLAESSDGPGRRTVGWCQAKHDPTKDASEMLGDVMRWHPNGKAIAVYSHHNKTLAWFSLDGSDVSVIGRAADSGDPRFPPHIAIAKGGQRVALATRSTFDECLALWVFEASKEGYASNLLTEVPGHDAFCSPFWSPEGVSLGVFISHLDKQKSGMVVFHGGGEGKGHILYDHELVDPPASPTWSPNGKSIAFMQTARDPADADHFPSQLVMMSVKKRLFMSLATDVFGQPRFLSKKRLVVDGDDAAYLLALAKS